MRKKSAFDLGRTQEFVKETQQPLGPENLLETIDLPDLGGS